MNKTITSRIIEPAQPWYWNVAQSLYFWGTLYFKGWQVEVTVNGESAVSEPAPKPPNPRDVASATLLARELVEGKSVAAYTDGVSTKRIRGAGLPQSQGGQLGGFVELVDRGGKGFTDSTK